MWYSSTEILFGIDWFQIAVYSRDIEWVPQGSQSIWFKDNPIKPVHDDILIAKLRPGQVSHSSRKYVNSRKSMYRCTQSRELDKTMQNFLQLVCKSSLREVLTSSNGIISTTPDYWHHLSHHWRRCGKICQLLPPRCCRSKSALRWRKICPSCQSTIGYRQPRSPPTWRVQG